LSSIHLSSLDGAPNPDLLASVIEVKKLPTIEEVDSDGKRSSTNPYFWGICNSSSSVPALSRASSDFPRALPSVAPSPGLNA